jgi:hypothetical protein
MQEGIVVQGEWRDQFSWEARLNSPTASRTARKISRLDSDLRLIVSFKRCKTSFNLILNFSSSIKINSPGSRAVRAEK